MKLSQKNIREQKRSARKNLSVDDKRKKSRHISEKVIQCKIYQQAQHIGAYLSMPEEVNVKAIIEAAWADGKKIYLPVVRGWDKPLQFAPYTPESILVKDVLGIKIPDIDKTHYLPAEQLDLVITPLVAFDKKRNRIGMGGGFYDRTFAFKTAEPEKPILLGVAFEIQRSNEIIKANHWDICPDKIISEMQSYSLCQ